MLFSGIPFLYYFLPCVLILYAIAPRKFKNFVLFISSLFFYAWGEPKYVFLMLGTIICGYFLALAIEKWRGRPLSKFALILSAVLFLSALGIFKYADFFIKNFNAVTGLSVPLLKIALPIGISFYTFQILSYTIDVYRGDVAARHNFVDLAAYITMFPQLIAGPIVRYADIEGSLTTREHTFSKTAEGVSLFVCGLAKKILIANVLGEVCDIFRASGEKTVLFFWIFGITYMLQIYFDFSGYSDMARGLGKFFGFDFTLNFNYPFISKSITEFWRRWHISLGTWFRDYVYIPLGGNRKGPLRHVFNICVVWFLTGFWHGAEWNFILWGVYFAILLLCEKFIWGKVLERLGALRHIYVLFLILISFIIFNCTTLSDIGTYVGGLFGLGGEAFANHMTLYYLRSYLVVIILAIIGATPIPKMLYNKLSSSKLGGAVSVIKPVILAILLIVMTAYLVDGSFNPFLYFRF